MADSGEIAFVKTHLVNIGALSVQFPDDFQQPPSSSLRKLPIIPVDLPAPPAREVSSGASSSDSIDLVFKVAKPAHSFSLTVPLTDTIASIKSQLASKPRAPPADAQRLLLRGKALVDGKLLKEYPVKGGDTINLMLKPSVDWSWSDTPPTSAPAPASAPAPPSPSNPIDFHSTAADSDVEMGNTKDLTLHLGEGENAKRGKHGRIPSVVLSPSPSSSSLPLDRPASPILLNVDTSNIPTERETTILDEYTKTLMSPGFWERLHAFLATEFSSPTDVTHAFESFLLGAKGSLTPSDIAKIRDTIGIHGMGGR